MLGRRSSANLLATSLPHCVRTTPLFSPFLPSLGLENQLYPSFASLLCCCFKKQSGVTGVFSAFCAFVVSLSVCCVVVSGDRTLVAAFATLVTRIKWEHLPGAPHRLF